VSIDEFLAEIRSKLPPAPADKLAQFEAELGTELPADYRQFLVACNGGFVGGRLWFMGPTPEGKPAEAGVHHIGGFREESHFSLDKTRKVYQAPELRIPRDLMWIMDDPFGNAICLAIKGPQRGRLYFWDHEQEPDPDDWDGSIETAGNVTLLANSFTEFVAGLQPLPEN
jgi:hypothetical protein